MNKPIDPELSANEILKALEAKESIALVIVGSLIGALPAMALYILFGVMEGVLAFFLVLPAFLVAFSARFVGRPFTRSARAIVGVISALVHLGGAVFLFVSPASFALIPASFIIGFRFSMAGLTEEEEKALWRRKRGIR